VSHSIDATVEMPVAAEVAFRYLCDPRNRPEWQSSLRSVEVATDEEPHLGQTWHDVTSVGVRPQMETTELTPYKVWTERGTWHGVTAVLTLRFTETPAGCRVRAEGDVSGTGAWAVAATAAGLLASAAVASDLRRASRVLERRTTQR
jgi:Polyketide cyclase / dehydrase and lipid transport